MASGSDGRVTTDLQPEQQHASDMSLTSDPTCEDKADKCIYPGKFYM